MTRSGERQDEQPTSSGKHRIRRSSTSESESELTRANSSDEGTGDVINLCPDDGEVEEIEVGRPEARVVRRRRPDLERSQVQHPRPHPYNQRPLRNQEMWEGNWGPVIYVDPGSMWSPLVTWVPTPRRGWYHEGPYRGTARVPVVMQRPPPPVPYVGRQMSPPRPATPPPPPPSPPAPDWSEVTDSSSDEGQSPEYWSPPSDETLDLRTPPGPSRPRND